VKDGAGKHVGLLYSTVGPPYKQSGAWMNAYRDQERFDGEVPTIVSNNSNFVKAGPGSRCWSAGTTRSPCSTSSATLSTPLLERRLPVPLGHLGRP